MKYIFDPKTDPLNSNIGGKAAALHALRKADVNIPAWLVVLPDAFEACLDEASLAHFKSTDDSGSLIEALAGLSISSPVRNAIEVTITKLCPNGERVAVRSSSHEEDGQEFSFAGQFDSYLFVKPELVSEHILKVWRSAFSERSLAYRERHALPLRARPPAVLIQHMVHAEASGVAFSADPVTGRRDITVISAIRGLGTVLVSGEHDADHYEVNRRGEVIKSEIAKKLISVECDPAADAGTREIILSDADANNSTLTATQIQTLAKIVHKIEELMGQPQDIEWALHNDVFYCLQSRLITAIHQLPDSDDILNLWDNSNITESYNGITTPLTFSFARMAYEGVYREFCQLLQVPAATLAERDQVFRCMLGFIRGRIYYNLLNWYRALAMLPGFKSNRAFMEQMMGVKEGLPEKVIEEMETSSTTGRIKDTFHMVRSVAALVVNHFRLNTRIRDFQQRLDTALKSEDPNLSKMRINELVDHFRQLERQLLRHWDAPLINDFLTMIFFGLFQKLGRKWCETESGDSLNALLRHQGGIISAEPARHIGKLALLARNHPALVDQLCEGSTESVRAAMRSHPEFKDQLDRYLERFGERCIEELKLESPTLHDEPLPLFRSIGQLAAAGLEAESSAVEATNEAKSRELESKHFRQLRTRPVRWMLLRWILKHTRKGVRHRENLRFERTRVFGRVRRIFTELGNRFHADHVLESGDDIFYLDIREIFSFVDGTATCTDLKGLVRLRRAEFETYREMPAPADRFETRGIVYGANIPEKKFITKHHESESQRQGTGCCPGIVRGRVRVINNPREASAQTGEILVASRTDPGWIILFPVIAGLVVERGSMLSHSAIIARELGIPTAVSVPGVTEWLQTGDLVELDGALGTVRKISSLTTPTVKHQKHSSLALS